jgi:hypothetical protein
LEHQVKNIWETIGTLKTTLANEGRERVSADRQHDKEHENLAKNYNRIVVSQDSVRATILRWWKHRNMGLEFLFPGDIVVEEEFGLGIGLKFPRASLYVITSKSKTEELFLLQRGESGQEGATLYGPRKSVKLFANYSVVRWRWKSLTIEAGPAGMAGYTQWSFEALRKGLEDHSIGITRLGLGLQADLCPVRYMCVRGLGLGEYNSNTGVNIVPSWPDEETKITGEVFVILRLPFYWKK